MDRAVIYARFSSDMQREESIDAQVRACRDYCKRKGYVVVNVYCDEAKSGRSTLERTAYNQMLADAISDAFDVIIFHKIDRNSRNEFNYYTFKDKLEKLGIRYEYAVQPIDQSPEGQMMESMLVGMAAYYSRNLSKETKKGLNENAYKALFNGGIAPFGYKIVDQHYIIDEAEAQAIRLIFNMYINGYGYGDICIALKEKGYKTRNGKAFGKNSIYDILGNEKYIGTYTFNKVPRSKTKRNSHTLARPEDFISIVDAIPAIVDKGDFEVVQNKRAHNKRRKAAYTAKDEYLLSGRVYCGYCGSAMCGHRLHPRKDVYYNYYACARKERVPGEVCKQKMVRKEILEHWVLQILEREVFSESGSKKFAITIVSSFNDSSKDMAKERAVLSAKKAGAEKKLDNLYKMFESGIADEYDKKRLMEVKEELRAIEKNIAQLADTSLPQLKEENVLKILDMFKCEIFENKNSHYIKRAIEMLVQRVTIKDSVLKLTLTTQNVCSYLVPRTRFVLNRYTYDFIVDMAA